MYIRPAFPSSATGYRHGWRRDPATLPGVTDANFRGVVWTPLAWVSVVKDGLVTGETVFLDAILLCGTTDPALAPRWRLASWEGRLDGITERPDALGAYTQVSDGMPIGWYRHQGARLELDAHAAACARAWVAAYPPRPEVI